MLAVQGNLANTYYMLGRSEKALNMRQDVYSGSLRLYGEEHELTLVDASNLASTLIFLKRFEEAKTVLRKTMPVARRVLGESHELSLKMRWYSAWALYKDPAATLDDIRKAITTLEETTRTARRVFGGAHPLTTRIEYYLRDARAALAARKTPRA